MDNVYFINENGKMKAVYNNEKFNLNLPVIVSASRATDIPAFFAKWFLDTLKRGHTKRINPFNNKPYFISFEKTRFIVFWTKNPAPIIPFLDEINSLINPKANDYQFYFQFTLNDYENENFEPNVPSLEKRIETFKTLSKKIGREKVIWRFDPLILTDSISVDALIKKIKKVGDSIAQYADKLVFSFADIGIYRKVKSNMSKANIKYVEFTEETMLEFAEKLSKLNEKWGLKLATCCEGVDLSEFGIEKNKCIDDELIEKISRGNEEIFKVLYGARNFKKYVEKKQELESNPLFGKEELIKELQDLRKKIKDKGQREVCGCVKSTDIGFYNTCMHLCVYCYANASVEKVKENYRNFLTNKGFY